MNKLKLMAAFLLSIMWVYGPAIAAQPLAPEVHKDDEKSHEEAGGHKDDEPHKDNDDHKERGGHKDDEPHKDDDDHKGGDQHEEGEGHKEGGRAGEHEENAAEVRLTTAQINEAGITVEPLKIRQMAITLSVPGEVRLNQYKTRIVTPRITAMVLKRHAKIGTFARQGQKLVTMFSVEMAQAQGEYVVAAAEWRRVQRLGEKIVSAKRATEAKVTFQQARARLLAYGVTKNQIATIAKNGDRSNPGQFDMLADLDGLIISDEFMVGEMIEPGKPIFRVTDPASRWVEARINPRDAVAISSGDEVTIKTEDEEYRGRVIQIAQAIDEKTRTLGVRIEVIDPQNSLRPGQFVDVILEGRTSETVLAVPKEAVIRTADGDWAVFHMVSPGQFKSTEIRVAREAGRFAVIEGIPAGAQVVTQGAFFVQSELAKSGFDIHNH